MTTAAAAPPFAITHDPKRNIRQRMHCVMSEIDYVKRGVVPSAGTGVFYDHLLELVRPILLAHGVYWYTTQVGEGRYVEPTAKALEKNGNLMIYKGQYATHFCNIDGEDEIVVAHEGQGNDFGDKGPGKASTYGAKLNLLRGLGLISGIADEARLPGEGDDPQPPAAKGAIAEPVRKSEKAAAPAAPAAAAPAAETATGPLPGVVNEVLAESVRVALAEESTGLTSKGLVEQIRKACSAKKIAKHVKATLDAAKVDIDAMPKAVGQALWAWLSSQADATAAA